MISFNQDTSITRQMSLKELPEDKTYNAHELGIQKFWSDNKVYELMQYYLKKKYFMDGPPFVSGKLHMGHALISFIKASLLRYYQMNGFTVTNKLGYDCHGLPIEQIIDKLNDIKTPQDVEKMGGVKVYNDKCREVIAKFSGSWTPIFQRLGRFANFDHTYKTMDTNFMESVWWTFKQMWDADLVYKGFRVMPFSIACGTPLSNFEATQNYKEVTTKTIYVAFKIKKLEDTYYVAWTTTPWTLPSNMALCVNPKANYVIATCGDKKFILAESCVNNINMEFTSVEFFATGEDLVKKQLDYEPLFPYLNRKSYLLVADNYVKDDGTGTGIVHLAPQHGEDDYRVCIEQKIVDNIEIGKLCLMTETGLYTNAAGHLAGKSAMESNEDIIKYLKQTHNHLQTITIKHNYPHCPRTDTPLTYLLVSSFFINVSKIKDKMIANNKKITWHPAHIETRFSNWLENAKDWGVSRSRYFGTPIPVWESKDDVNPEQVCIGSIEELVKKAKLNYTPKDLHPEFIKDIVIISEKTGKELRYTNSVFDCWFESGAVPIAQLHYPFENEGYFKNRDYLSDYVVEGLDQTRGWFYTLLVISTAIFDKPPFKHVLCTGLVNDEKGQKMSKRLNNVKDPNDYLEKYGADVLGLYLMNSPLINAEELSFSDKDITKVKQQLIPYINVNKFFIDHVMGFLKKGHKFDFDIYKKSDHFFDLWIVSHLGSLTKQVEDHMENFEINRAITKIMNFIDNLTNWYAKLNRERIKGLYGIQEQTMSLSTMYYVLITYIKLIAPFMPFLAEHLYQYLKVVDDNNKNTSVLSEKYPESKSMVVDAKLEQKFKNLQQVVCQIRQLRQNSKDFKSIKTCISKLIISHNDPNFLLDIQSLVELVEDEVNCLDYQFQSLKSGLTYELMPNNSVIGTKYKKEALKVKNMLMNCDQKTVQEFVDSGKQVLVIDNLEFELEKDFKLKVVPNKDMSAKNMVSNIEGEIMITMCTDYNQDVHNLSQLRKLHVFVQNMRKKTELKPWDNIDVDLTILDQDLEQYFIANKNTLETKLKCKITINEFAQKVLDVYASDMYTWTDFKDQSIEYKISVRIYKL
jgi:isoleucyl-tRNA synthetase